MNQGRAPRVETALKTLESPGGESKSFHLTMGPYDSVDVIEAPTTRQSPDSAWRLAS